MNKLLVHTISILFAEAKFRTFRRDVETIDGRNSKLLAQIFRYSFRLDGHTFYEHFMNTEAKDKK